MNELFKVENKLISQMLLFLVVLLFVFTVFAAVDVKDNRNYNEELVFSNIDYFGKNPHIFGDLISITNEEYDFEELTYILEDKAIIFPRELLCDNALYFNYNRFVATDAGYQYRAEIYLECQYSYSVFYEEIKRISNISTSKDDITMNIVSCTDLFSLPSYVCVYNYNGEFEYVLVDDNNKRIIYIYLKDIKSVDNIVFDMQYAPHKQLSDSSFPSEFIHKNYYNIYFYS